MAESNIAEYEIVIKKKVPGVILKLSMEEAVALRSLFNHVGGDPSTTARCYIDSILAALDSIGIPALKIDDASDGKYTAFYFVEDSKTMVEEQAKEL